MVNASQEALWLRHILLEFIFQQQHPTSLWCDNQSAIKLIKDSVQHQRRKHIELHMHFIKKLIHDQVIEVLFFSTKDQVADIFTKSLIEAKFSKLRSMLGVQEVVIKGGQALMPLSFSCCVTIVNISILSQFVLKGGCQDIQTLRSQLRSTCSNVSLGKSVFLQCAFAFR